MKRALPFLFLNCFILFIAAAGDTGNDPQGPAQSSSVTAPLPESNEPNMVQRLQVVRERLIKNQRPGEINRPAAEQRRANVRRRAGRYQAFETQLAEEYRKHNLRIAILNRIRQLAEQEGLADTIEKADNLIKMENDRHTKKVTQLHRKPLWPVEKSEKNRQIKTPDISLAETNLPRQGTSTAGEPNK